MLKSPRAYKINQPHKKTIISRISSPAFDNDSEQETYVTNLTLGDNLNRFGFSYLKNLRKTKKNILEKEDNVLTSDSDCGGERKPPKKMIPSGFKKHHSKNNQRGQEHSIKMDDYLQTDINLSNQLAKFKIIEKREEQNKVVQQPSPNFRLHLNIKIPMSAKSGRSNTTQNNSEIEDLQTQITRTGHFDYKQSYSQCSTPSNMKQSMKEPQNDYYSTMTPRVLHHGARTARTFKTSLFKDSFTEA